jgi:hypothetical protein
VIFARSRRIALRSQLFPASLQVSPIDAQLIRVNESAVSGPRRHPHPRQTLPRGSGLASKSSPASRDALPACRQLGYHLFLFTNQSGIARGLHTLDDVLRCNARMEELLGFPDRSSPTSASPPRAPTIRSCIASRRRGFINEKRRPSRPRSGAVLDGRRSRGRYIDAGLNARIPHPSPCARQIRRHRVGHARARTGSRCFTASANSSPRSKSANPSARSG